MVIVNSNSNSVSNSDSNSELVLLCQIVKSTYLSLRASL